MHRQLLNRVGAQYPASEGFGEAVSNHRLEFNNAGAKTRRRGQLKGPKAREAKAADDALGNYTLAPAAR
jgi:hypothetical protein